MITGTDLMQHLVGKRSLIENVGVEWEEFLTLVDVLCVHQYSIMFVLPFLWWLEHINHI